MTLAELIDSFRADADDRVAPFLWADVDVVRWFNEAEAEAAIRARLIFDSGFTIDVRKDVSGYPFTSLFEITRADLFTIDDPLADPVVYSRTPECLRATSHDEMDRCHPDWRYDSRRPAYFIQEDARIFLPNIVDDNYLIRLEGYRTPTTPLDVEDLDAEPEIAPVHHRFLVHWALHRAYSKPDTEVFNPQKSATALLDFERYFGLRPDAALNKRNQANRPHHNRAYW